MKRDIAERLAAAENDRMPVSAVAPTVDALLRYLSTCTACDGEGTLTFKTTTRLQIHDSEPSLWEWAGPAGTVIDCLACGGSGQDPEFIVWYCVDAESRKNCETYKNHFTGEKFELHRPCGQRVMLPIPLPPVEPDSPQPGGVEVVTTYHHV